MLQSNFKIVQVSVWSLEFNIFNVNIAIVQYDIVATFTAWCSLVCLNELFYTGMKILDQSEVYLNQYFFNLFKFVHFIKFNMLSKGVNLYFNVILKKTPFTGVYDSLLDVTHINSRETLNLLFLYTCVHLYKCSPFWITNEGVNSR